MIKIVMTATDTGGRKAEITLNIDPTTFPVGDKLQDHIMEAYGRIERWTRDDIKDLDIVNIDHISA